MSSKTRPYDASTIRGTTSRSCYGVYDLAEFRNSDRPIRLSTIF